MSASYNSPYDLTDRRACGHPNGHCENCGRPAASLEADYCSPGCRSEAAQQEAREAALEEELLEIERARATCGELAEREPERPEPPEKPREVE